MKQIKDKDLHKMLRERGFEETDGSRHRKFVHPITGAMVVTHKGGAKEFTKGPTLRYHIRTIHEHDKYLKQVV
jgi:predicted RNA binding protein YcfA (HicA-like mRNA interferase family)